MGLHVSRHILKTQDSVRYSLSDPRSDVWSVKGLGDSLFHRSLRCVIDSVPYFFLVGNTHPCSSRPHSSGSMAYAKSLPLGTSVAVQLCLVDVQSDPDHRVLGSRRRQASHIGFTTHSDRCIRSAEQPRVTVRPLIELHNSYTVAYHQLRTLLGWATRWARLDAWWGTHYSFCLADISDENFSPFTCLARS